MAAIQHCRVIAVSWRRLQDENMFGARNHRTNKIGIIAYHKFRSKVRERAYKLSNSFQSGDEFIAC